MEPRSPVTSRVLPIGLVLLGLLQGAFALHDGRMLRAASAALVVVAGAVSLPRGMTMPVSGAWRAFWLVLAIAVVGTLALAWFGARA